MKRSTPTRSIPLGMIVDYALLVYLVLMVLQVVPPPPVGEWITRAAQIITSR